MTSARKHLCKLPNDSFCYICGEHRSSSSLRAISENVRQIHSAYFGRLIREKEWTPRVVCTSCVVRLKDWMTGKRSKMPFGIPMLWSEPANHETDCYFCVTNVRGLSNRKRDTWKYPVLASAQRPQPHSTAVPVPIWRENDAEAGRAVVEEGPVNISGNTTSESDESFRFEQPDGKFDQKQLNDLVRDLRLPKDAPELLASRLSEKNVLEPCKSSKLSNEDFCLDEF